jgi:hypothetical protein
VVQQEEACQRERFDHRQLLLQPGAGFAQRHARIALEQAFAAQLRQTSLGGLVLDARVAVAEVAGEVEVQLLGQRGTLGNRLRMVAEARLHRRRGGEHVRAVGASQRFAGLQREVMTARHEGVLERHARSGMGMDVAARHAAQSQARGERGERGVAGAVAGEKRSLQLDAQPFGAESLAQPPHAGLLVHAVLRAAGQADQPLGVCANGLQRDRRRRRLARAFAGVGVGERQQAAEVAPAALAGDQQREVTSVGEAELGAVNRAQTQSASCVCELHRAIDAVMVGQRERLVAELERGGGELLGQRGAVEE